MNDTELLHLLALLKIEGVGDIVAKKLINHCGSAQNVFTSKIPFLKNIDGVGEVLIKNLKNKTVFQLAETELKYIKENDIQVSFYKDDNYPERLKHCIYRWTNFIVFYRKHKLEHEENY
jgi:DNA processing protein